MPRVLRLAIVALLSAGALYFVVGTLVSKAHRDAAETIGQLVGRDAPFGVRVMAVDSAVAPGSYVLYENEQVAEIRVRGEVSIPSVSDNNIQVFFARWRKGPPGQALLADTSLAGIASKTGDRASPVTITLRRMTQGPPRVLYGYLAVGPQSKFVRVYSE